MKQFYVLGTRLIFVLGLIGTLFMLLPVLSFEDIEFTGYEVVFGVEILDVNPFNLGSIASAKLPFSFLAFLAFLLPLVGGIIALASKKLLLLSLVLFVVGFFLLIILPNNINIVYTVAGSESTESVDWNAMFGLVGAIVATGLAAIANLVLILKP
ncbi:MAG: hypothetical protein ACOC1L_00375 [Bacillota bacterium]